MPSNLEIPRTETLYGDETPSSACLSSASTYVDLTTATEKAKSLSLKSGSNEQIATEPSLPQNVAKVISNTGTVNNKPKLSQRKKWSLLAMFSLAFFIDIWCYSAFFIFTDPIAVDLGVIFAQQSWIITSYAVTFASTLLLWGRVSDLWSAKPVFTWGFLSLGVLNLIISFMPDKYSFFVLRAIAGIAGATLIPASYRLIPFVFEEHELATAFTVYGMSGALSNVSGTLVAGFIEYIPGSGQMIAWRWFFRIVAALVIPVSVLAFYYVPRPDGDDSNPEIPKWKRVDLVGSFLILAAVILLILGLTLGAAYGWKKAGFLVPFLLSFVFFPAFFVWEARLPEGYAILPPSTWRVPNFTMFMIFALQIYAWWGINFLAFIETFIKVEGEHPIIAAVRTLPQGISALSVTLLLTFVPSILKHPRWPITFGMVLAIVSLGLMVVPDRYVGVDYWRYLFPAFIIGSGGMMVAFTGTTVGVMTAVPANMSGVAGAALQMSLQVGSAVGFSIQAGLFTVNPGSIANPANVHASLYFQLGWAALWLIGFLVLYRAVKNSGDDEEGQKVIVAH